MRTHARTHTHTHIYTPDWSGKGEEGEDGREWGDAVKHEMSHALNKWMEVEENLAKWVGEGENALKMWEKRVLITHLLAEAWEKVASTFDFEKAATRVGMRMTVDGSGDSDIRLQGVEGYSFTDADGGEAGADGANHGIDTEEAALLESEVLAGEGEEGDGEEVEEGDGDGAESDLSEDDTAEPLQDQVGGIEDPPTGFEFVEKCPPLETEADLKALIGQSIMHAWATTEILGWFQGKVTHMGCSHTDLKATPTANMVIQYKKTVTKHKRLNGRVASTLTADRYGKGEWWVLLKPFVE